LKVVSWYSFVRSGQDAFSDSDLDEVLRKYGISHLFLAGGDGTTSVAQTARSALALGYRVTFVQDGIFTASEGRWERLLKDFESAAAFAITSDEFAELAEAVHKVSEAQRSWDITVREPEVAAEANPRMKRLRRARRRRAIASVGALLLVAAIAAWWLNRSEAFGKLDLAGPVVTQGDGEARLQRDHTEALARERALQRWNGTSTESAPDRR
jgi:hypothetical protein